MKTIRLLLPVICCILLWAWPAAAQKVYTVDNVPNTRLSDSRSSVSNPDGTLSTAAVARINSELAELEKTTSIEVAVVVVESIGEMPIEDFGIRLFRKWGIGKKKKDNGLLLLLVTRDRLVRFEVGYGLEGVMTDAMSKRIISQRMNPYLRSDDWDGAVLAAVGAVKEVLSNPDSDLRREAEADEMNSILTPLLIVFGMVLLVMVVATLAYRKARKCPRCGTMMKIVKEETVKLSPSTSQTTTTLRCPKCGYVTTKKRTQNIGGAIAGGMIGGMMGGFGGGRGGGFGGFGGGGFGGGSAGGGGATGRF